MRHPLPHYYGFSPYRINLELIEFLYPNGNVKVEVFQGEYLDHFIATGPFELKKETNIQGIKDEGTFKWLIAHPYLYYNRLILKFTNDEEYVNMARSKMKRNYRQYETPQTIDFTKLTINLNRTLEDFQKQYDQLTRIIKLCDCNPVIKEFLLEYAKDAYAKENDKGPYHFEALLKDPHINIQNLKVGSTLNPNHVTHEGIGVLSRDSFKNCLCCHIENQTNKRHALIFDLDENDIITKIENYHA